MSYMTRRDYQEASQKISRELYLSSKPAFIRPILRFWDSMWQVIYYLVSILTYLGILTGLGITFYQSFYKFDLERAVIGGLCTLLIIYVNKVNPK